MDHDNPVEPTTDVVDSGRDLTLTFGPIMSKEVKSGAPLPWEQVGPERARTMKRAGIVVDVRRCIGCHSCSVACKTEHQVPLGIFRTRVHYLQRPEHQAITFVPMLCMHCRDAPCITACPTSALGTTDDGRVVVDEQRCNGTKSCIPACPYGAIAIHPATGVAEKCDLCQQRTAVGLDPACVEACPTTALRFGDLAESEDPVSRYADDNQARPYREAAGTKPTVTYVGHESWVEDRARSVQRGVDEDGLVYE